MGSEFIEFLGEIEERKSFFAFRGGSAPGMNLTTQEETIFPLMVFLLVRRS